MLRLLMEISVSRCPPLRAPGVSSALVHRESQLHEYAEEVEVRRESHGEGDGHGIRRRRKLLLLGAAVDTRMDI